MRIVMYTLGAIVVLFTLSLTGFFFYGSPVGRSSLRISRFSETETSGHLVVTVSGRLIGGMMAVRKAEQMRTGSCIILLIRNGITRPGLRDATFHYDIQVPSDVDQISLGKAESVIWTRKH